MTHRQIRLFLAITLLLAVAFMGTSGFHYIEGWTWFDGFYMTLTTMATVGYGETHPLSHAGRIFQLVSDRGLGGGARASQLRRSRKRC